MPRSHVDILFLAAHPPELVGLHPHLSERTSGVLHGLSVVAKTIGVGMAVSGASAAHRIHQLHPRAVILMGSCGVYPGPHAYRPLDLVVADRCHLFDPSVAAGKSAFPEPMQTALAAHPELSAGLAASARTRCASVATTLAITTDDAVAGAVHPANGFEAENLELFPVAVACRAAQVPFAAVLSVTNVVGSSGRADWRQFQHDAAIAVAESLVTWIRGGAQGLPHRTSTPTAQT